MKVNIVIISLLFLVFQPAFADEPIINYNVTVMTNSSPSQCTENWNGSAGQQDVMADSGLGSDTGTVVGVQSCVGCTFDNQTNNCICKTCYVHY